MRIVNYKLEGECLKMEFDKSYTDIRIQTIEPIPEDTTNLDYMSMSLQFSKPKKEIDIRVKPESSYIIVVANDQAIRIQRDNDAYMEMGIATLFKEIVPTSRIGCGLDQLKNENIYATVKRR
jgi:hypothetical protein